MIDFQLFGGPCAGCGSAAIRVCVGASVDVNGARRVANVVQPCRCVLNVRPAPLRPARSLAAASVDAVDRAT